MTGHYGTQHWPLEIRHKKDDKVLEIDFDDGKTFVLPAELLRVESPSAEVQGHGPGEKQVVSGRRYVGIMEIEPVGNYAVKIVFDDLHETGIYSWEYLYELGEKKDEIWRRYLKSLTDAGLSRDPRGEEFS
jgi:DUF971 family protein